MTLTASNGFDSGTNGATATTSSIASSGTGLAFQKLGATAATFSATDAIDGALAIEFPRTSGSTCYVQTTDALNTLDVSFSFMFTYKTALPGTNDYLFDVRAGTVGSTTSLVRMLTPASAVPFMQLSGSTLSTGTIATAALVVNTQYRCDVRIHVDASAGAIHADFYTPTGSSPIANLAFAQTSKNTGASTIKDVRMGPSGSNTVSSGTFVLDLPRIDATQSSSYLGPNTAAAPTVAVGYFLPQTVPARGSIVLPGTPTWAVGHTGTVLWTGGSTPISNATSNNATVTDIGWPALAAGDPIKDDTVTYTFTATQDDAQTATGTMTVTRVCGNRWTLKGTQFVCAPLVKDR